MSDEEKILSITAAIFSDPLCVPSCRRQQNPRWKGFVRNEADSSWRCDDCHRYYKCDGLYSACVHLPFDPR